MPDKIEYLPSRPVGKPITADQAERSRFYSSKRWAKHRRAYLAKHPLCVKCQAKGRITAATIVHHVIERLDDPRLAWEWSNFEAVCSPCHTRHHNATRAQAPPGGA